MTRGKIRITYSIHDRPKSADDRNEFGQWEADTVANKTGSACLMTLTDRKSRFLLTGKASRKKAAYASEKMIELLSNIPNEIAKTVTPDREKEFSNHFAVTEVLNNVPFYFPNPHAPCQRGPNSLNREYLPKSKEMDTVDNSLIYQMVEKSNSSPRKCLSRKTPYEVFFK